MRLADELRAIQVEKDCQEAIVRIVFLDAWIRACLDAETAMRD